VLDQGLHFGIGIDHEKEREIPKHGLPKRVKERLHRISESGGSSVFGVEEARALLGSAGEVLLNGLKP
jgi:hypothetical protein